MTVWWWLYLVVGVVAAGSYLCDTGGLWDWRGAPGLAVLAAVLVAGWPLFVGLDIAQRWWHS